MKKAHRVIAALGAALTLAAAAGAVAISAAAAAPVAPVSTINPAIAWTGSAVLVTAADSDGNLDYWWQAAGSGVWHQQQVAAATSGFTYSNPAILWTRNAVLVTAADSDGNIDYWWQAAGSGVWHQQQVAAATSGFIYSNPAIVWTGNAVLVTAKDSSGNLDYWWQGAGTGVWHQQQVAGEVNGVTYSNPAIVWTGNAVLVTATDIAGDLHYWWQGAGTGVWHPQFVATSANNIYYSNPAIVWTGNAVLVTAADSNGNLDYWWQGVGTGVWHPQQIATTTSNEPTYSKPAIVWTGSAVLVTAADSSGSLHYWRQGAGTGVWSHQQVAAATSGLTYSNPAIVWTGNATLVIAPDSAGNLDYWSQGAGTGVWHQQQVAAGVVSWRSAIEVPGTAALNTGAYAAVASVSCPSAGNCTVGGSYTDSARNVQAFVADEVNGTWGDAIEVPGTTTLNVGPSAKVTSVSCGSAGNCVAGGYYSSSSTTVSTQAFVADEVKGSWGNAMEIPGIAALNTGLNAQVTSVSCPSAGNCAAVGYYGDGGSGANGANGAQAFVADEANGTWGNAIEVPGTAAVNTGDLAHLASVSCSSAGNCAAGGWYEVSLGNGSYASEAFVASEVNGAWGNAIEVPGTAAVNTGDYAEVDSVSCSSAGNCVAAGWYSGGASVNPATQAFVVSDVNGTWGTAIELPSTGGGGRVYSVSCPSDGNCAAGGTNSSGAFVADQINGTWGAPVPVPDTSGVTSAFTGAMVTSVSCQSPGNCAVGGDYGGLVYFNPNLIGYRMFVVSEVNGTLENPIQVPGPAASYANLASVSCPAVGSCTAAGWYYDVSNNVHAFVVSQN